jgi:flagellar biosynthesis chaperone FliJ
MLPGVERAIMNIGDMMPELVRSIEKLAKAIGNKHRHEGKDDIMVQVNMTADEWQEVANAIDIRRVQVEKMESDVDMDQEQLNIWVVTLGNAYKKLTRVLDSYNVSY